MSVRNHPFLSGPAFTIACLLLGMTGCASRTEDLDTGNAPPGIAVGKSGYRAVKVTGSHIPVLVPTSPTARPLPSALRVRTMSPDELEQLTRRGQR